MKKNNTKNPKRDNTLVNSSGGMLQQRFGEELGYERRGCARILYLFIVSNKRLRLYNMSYQDPDGIGDSLSIKRLILESIRSFEPLDRHRILLTESVLTPILKPFPLCKAPLGV